MKLFKSFLIKTTLASHFRGSTWLTSIDANGDLQIDNPQAWRKTSSGLSGKIICFFSIIVTLFNVIILYLSKYKNKYLYYVRLMQ